ncbi:XRE family transcriptional regulator [Komagataeibacter oboediens]|uniref:XRE family transcriptional regulator n=1 Tax=Komagataeibacter oboediens TaxID=65958 RepID=UPI0018DC3BD4|nr:LexA family transcriptional regulator [Komagataeibacter oboediens]
MKAEPILTRVREIKEARGMTSAELSRRCGISPATLSKIELGHRSVTKNSAPRLAKALEVNVADLYADVGAPIEGITNVVDALPSESIGRKIVPIEAPRVALPLHVPIYGTAACSSGDGAFLLLSGEVVDRAPLAPGIQHRKEVYGLYIEGDSMEPWKRPGQLVYVDPVRAPSKRDRVVVVVRDDRRGINQAYIKEFVKKTDNHLVVVQYNPPKTIEWDIADIVSCHRILEPEDIF